MQPGTWLREGLLGAIDACDRLLLCCSECSLGSSWVETELEYALSKEDRAKGDSTSGVPIVVPVMIDEALLSWESSYREILLARSPANFVGWESDDSLLMREMGKLTRFLRDTERFGSIGRLRPFEFTGRNRR